jgi:hypothetical protein
VFLQKLCLFSIERPFCFSCNPPPPPPLLFPSMLGLLILLFPLTCTTLWTKGQDNHKTWYCYPLYGVYLRWRLEAFFTYLKEKRCFNITESCWLHAYSVLNSIPHRWWSFCPYCNSFLPFVQQHKLRVLTFPLFLCIPAEFKSWQVPLQLHTEMRLYLDPLLGFPFGCVTGIFTFSQAKITHLALIGSF